MVDKLFGEKISRFNVIIGITQYNRVAKPVSIDMFVSKISD